MRLLVAISPLFAALAAVAAAEAPDQKPAVVRAEILRAGIYSEEIDWSRASEQAILSQVNEPKLRLATTKVPARIGTTFGFEYKLTGGPDGAPVEVVERLYFPRASAPRPSGENTAGVRKSVDEARFNRSFYSSYTFDKPSELIPGKWRFELWVGDRKLAQEEFVVTAS